MGTLVKEDFGCPNRDDTMVETFQYLLYFPFYCILFVLMLFPFLGNAAWIL